MTKWQRDHSKSGWELIQNIYFEQWHWVKFNLMKFEKKLINKDWHKHKYHCSDWP